MFQSAQAVQKAPTQTAVFNSIISAIKKGDSQSLITGIETLNGMSQGNSEVATAIITQLLPNAVEAITKIVESRFDGRRHSDAALLKIWEKRDPQRSAYTHLLGFVDAVADRERTTLPEELCLRAHIPLIAGPAALRTILVSQVYNLDQRLTYSQGFTALDTACKNKIIDAFRKLGIDQIITSTRTSRAVPAQAICNIAMEHYKFAPIVIESDPKFESIAAYRHNRTIVVNPKLMESFSNELKLWTILHECRHAIQFGLVDGLLFARHDGSPTQFKHSGVHPFMGRYQQDIERIWLSTVAREIKSDIQYLTSRSADIAYALQFNEKDADGFAAHIVSVLTGKDEATIMRNLQAAEGKMKLAAPETKTAEPKSSLILDPTELKPGKIILPNAQNAWGTEGFRDLLHDGLEKVARKGSAPADPFAHLLIKAPPKEAQEYDPEPSLDHDPEVFARYQKSLNYLVSIADFSSQAAIKRDLPRLMALSREPICGENGLRLLARRLDEALKSEIKLTPKVRESLTDCVRELRSKFVDRKEKTDRQIRTEALKLLKQPKAVPVPLNERGEQQSLWDTCEYTRRDAQKGNVLALAQHANEIDAHIEQGCLGELPQRRAVGIIGEIIERIREYSDKDIKSALTARYRRLARSLTPKSKPNSKI